MPPSATARPRRVAVGSDIDHATAAAVARHLEERGIAVVRAGAVDGRDTPWPDVAEQVGRLVAQGAVDQGVLCCWTGTGVSIAANKVSGVRAALCVDADTATGARRWNDANVLALSLASTDVAQARRIVDAWLEVAKPDPDEAPNIARIDELERRYRDGPRGGGG
jgi:ribose 5-phosphate isomerase B